MEIQSFEPLKPKSRIDLNGRYLSQSETRRLYVRDGCRAWIVCVCAVLSQIIIFGCTVTFGVVFPVFLNEFKEGKAKTAWVGSLALALAHILCPLAAKLIDRLGARPCTIVGSIVAAVGLITTSFVDRIDLMYFTYSILFAVGVSLTLTANFDIVPKYFKKNISIAMGLMVSGIGIAFLVMSPILETLLIHVGWRNTYRTISGMALLVCACGLSFSPHVEKDIETQAPNRRPILAHQERVQDNSLLRNGRYVVCCLCYIIYQLGNTIPVVHMSRYAQDCGLAPSQAAYLYIGYGVLSVIGRLLSGRLLHNRSVQACYVCFSTSLVLGIPILLCPLAGGFIGLLLMFSIFGFCDGIHATSIVVLVQETCSKNQSTRAYIYGWFFGMLSLGIVSGPPLGGFIADQMGSYTPAFYTAGSSVLFSAVVILATKCFKHQNYEGKTRTELVRLSEDDMVIREKVTVL